MNNRITIAALLLLGSSTAALAQSNPNLQFGQVPTAAQWNSYFSAKQDYFGSPAAIATSGSASDLITGVVPTARLPIATTGAVGVVKPDGTTITVNGSGVISASGAGVSSFNGRTGAVVPTTNDYTFSQIGTKPTTLSGYGITDGATNGANSNITSLTGLTTPLSASQGGTGVNSLGSGVAAFLQTPSSANLLAALTNSTGTGNNVFANSPVLTAPVFGTIVNTGTLTLPTATDTLVGRSTTDTLANKTLTSPTINGGALSGTFTGTPVLNLASATGLPISTGVAGLGTGIATALGTPSSANFRAAVTDESGTGAMLFQGGALGTVAAGSVLTNATGLPLGTGVTGILPAANGGAGTINGLMKANGAGLVSAAVVGTDYAAATTGSSILYGNGAGGFSLVTVGSGLSFTGGTLSATGSGGNATISPTSGNTVGNVVTMGSTTTGITDSGIAVSSLAAAGTGADISTNTAVLAAEFNNFKRYTYIASVTLTLPSAASVSASPGGLVLVTGSFNGTLTASGTDTITFNNTTSAGGGSVTLPSAGTYIVSANAAGGGFTVGGAGVTGSGNIVRANSPTLVTPVLGTVAAGSILTNATGLPLTTGVTGILPIANGGTGGSAAGVALLTSLGALGGTPSATTYLDGSGNWSTPAGGGGGSPGGSNTQLQYNNAGNFGGLPLTWNGSSLAYSQSSALSTIAFNLTGNPVTSGGNGTTTVPLVNIGGGNAPTTYNTVGTMVSINEPASFNGIGLEIRLNGAAASWQVSAAGNQSSTGSMSIGPNQPYTFSGRSKITSAADGNIALQNNATNAFSLLQFGGTTSSFPAIKRNTTALNVRLADDSADAAITAAGVTASGSLINTGITTDTGHTDSTVCQDSTTHQFYFGSGTLGVCLGTSTMRAKENIVAVNDNAVSQIMALKPVEFNYKNGWGYDPKKKYFGFLAEDVEKVIPSLVGHNESGQTLNADYIGMIPLMVKTIQEQQTVIESLKSKLGAQ